MRTWAMKRATASSWACPFQNAYAAAARPGSASTGTLSFWLPRTSRVPCHSANAAEYLRSSWAEVKASAIL